LAGFLTLKAIVIEHKVRRLLLMASIYSSCVGASRFKRVATMVLVGCSINIHRPRLLKGPVKNFLRSTIAIAHHEQRDRPGRPWSSYLIQCVDVNRRPGHVGYLVLVIRAISGTHIDWGEVLGF